MTKPCSACSRFRLAEDMSGNSYVQPQTAVRMVNRKQRESAVGPRRETAVPLNVCLVIRLFHRLSVIEHLWPGRCWE